MHCTVYERIDAGYLGLGWVQVQLKVGGCDRLRGWPESVSHLRRASSTQWYLHSKTLPISFLPAYQAGAFKIGDTAGTLDNIIACKLNRPGMHTVSICDLSQQQSAVCCTMQGLASVVVGSPLSQ